MKSELSLFVLATEDKEKILNCIAKTLNVSKEKLEKIIRTQKLKGHFGYLIEYLKVKFNEEETANLLKTIFKKLSEADKYYFLEEIDEYIDVKGNLYLRLDKQRICLGKVSLSDKDPVKIDVKGKREKIISLIKKVIEEDELL